MQNNQKLHSERKFSNSSMISTSLNGPITRQRNSIKNDISSNLTKKEWGYGNQYHNNRYDLILKDELNELNEIYYNKKNELNDVMNEYEIKNKIYKKKYNNLVKNKEKYESLRQKNLYLKLMIMRIIKIKNKTKD